MKHAINIINFGDCGDARVLADLAWEAENAGWDGVLPILRDAGIDNIPSPHQIREIIAFVRDHRQTDTAFDVVVAGETPGDDPRQAANTVARYAEAGVTWWQEAIHGMRPDLAKRAEASSWIDAMRWRIQQGPAPL